MLSTARTRKGRTGAGAATRSPPAGGLVAGACTPPRAPRTGESPSRGSATPARVATAATTASRTRTTVAGLVAASSRSPRPRVAGPRRATAPCRTSTAGCLPTVGHVSVAATSSRRPGATGIGPPGGPCPPAPIVTGRGIARTPGRVATATSVSAPRTCPGLSSRRPRRPTSTRAVGVRRVGPTPGRTAGGTAPPATGTVPGAVTRRAGAPPLCSGRAGTRRLMQEDGIILRNTRRAASFCVRPRTRLF